MKNVNEIKNYAVKIMENLGLDTSLPVKVDGRMTTPGWFAITWDNKALEIKFSRDILFQKEELQKDIIRHEVAHYYVFCKYGVDPKIVNEENNGGHGRLFREICKELNCNGTPYIKAGEWQYRFDVYCLDCEKIIFSSRKETDVIKGVKKGYCKCVKCRGENLIVIDNLDK